ncbi:MAG: hypothetical protein GF419_05875 [Ignavibacteriales bacterium]|nr:hypothetical protein [Ignavibacteriales bacterium]
MFKKHFVFLFSALISAALIFGCGEIKLGDDDGEETEKTEKTEKTTTEDEPKPDDAAGDKEIVEEEEEVEEEEANLPNVVGTYTGKFDGRKFTLTIASQDGNTITGTTNAAYAHPLQHTISGTINFDANTFTFNGQGDNPGTYSGTVTGNYTTMNGKFTAGSRTVDFTASK